MSFRLCFFSKIFRVYWLWKGKIAFRLERPINTPIKNELQLTKQAGEGEGICVWRAHVSRTRPSGQGLSAKMLLREGAGSPYVSGKVGGKSRCMFTSSLCAVQVTDLHVMFHYFTHINELYLTFCLQSSLYLEKKTYFKKAALHSFLYTGIFLFASLWRLAIMIEMKVSSDILGTKWEFNEHWGSGGSRISIPVSTAVIKVFSQSPLCSLLITVATTFLHFIFEKISG